MSLRTRAKVEIHVVIVQDSERAVGKEPQGAVRRKEAKTHPKQLEGACDSNAISEYIPDTCFPDVVGG